VAPLLASRVLARAFGPPGTGPKWRPGWKGCAWELGDTVALSSDFHGLDQEEFTVSGKDLDLAGRSVRLSWTDP